ncbi:hypothetical protein D3C72_2223460 [compost metagenome]
MLGTVERVGHRLVNGHGHSLGRGIGRITGVNGKGFNAHGRWLQNRFGKNNGCNSFAKAGKYIVRICL